MPLCIPVPYYEPGPHHYSQQGYPIWVLVEDDGTKRWVVQRPDGTFYSNIQGQPVVPQTADDKATLAGAAIGAAVGAMWGPVGAVIGGVLGAFLGKKASEP